MSLDVKKTVGSKLVVGRVQNALQVRRVPVSRTLVVKGDVPTLIAITTNETRISVQQDQLPVLEVSVAGPPKILIAHPISSRGGGGGGGAVKVSANDTTAGDLEAKVAAGTGIALVTLNEGGNEQQEISAIGSATNVGAAAEIFKQKTGADLELRTLTAGENVTLVQFADVIEISSSGGGSEGEGTQDFAFTGDSKVPGQGTLGLFIGLADSLASPLPMHEASTLVWVSVAVNQSDATNDYDVEVLVDGVVRPAATLALPSGSAEEYSAPLAEALIAQAGVGVRLIRTAGSGKSDFDTITVTLVFETPRVFGSFSSAFSSAYRKPVP